MNSPFSQPETNANTSTLDVLKFQIPTMTCGSCIQRVKHALMQVDGVLQVAARRDLQEVTIHHDPQRVDAAGLRSVLSQAGYPAAA